MRLVSGLVFSVVATATCAFGKKHHRGRREVLEFDIDLDAPASERFKEVVTHFEPQIHDLFLFLVRTPAVKQVFEAITHFRGAENPEFQAEIQSTADVMKIDVNLVHAAQFLYELNTLMVPIINFTNYKGLEHIGTLEDIPWKGPGCTGIVAYDERDGTVNHARNLDFAPPALMQAMTYTAVFHKGGEELYKAQMIAGYQLPLTAMKKGAWTYETNTRFANSEDENKQMFAHMFARGDDRRETNGWSLRKAFEESNSYDELKNRVASDKYIAPMYNIMSGIKDGVMFAHGHEGVVYEMHLNEPNHYHMQDRYILQTNFDFYWKDIREFFDPTGGLGYSRRRQAMKLINPTKTLTPDFLFSVLDHKHVKSGDTIYQVIMNAETGLFNQSIPWAD